MSMLVVFSRPGRNVEHTCVGCVQLQGVPSRGACRVDDVVVFHASRDVGRENAVAMFRVECAPGGLEGVRAEQPGAV